MPTVNMLEAKTQLSRLVEQIASGELREIIIARNGKPAARIVPLEQHRPRYKLGVAQGQYPKMDYEAFKAKDVEIAAMFGLDEPSK
jgi:prevent-host-death family protein